VALRGSVLKRPPDGIRWLVSERRDVSSVKRGDPAVGRRSGGKSEPA